MNSSFPEIHQFEARFDDAISKHREYGHIYSDSKALSWKLQEMRKSILAKIACGFTGSEASKERQALASKEYIEYLGGVSQAIAQEQKDKVDYDNIDKEYEKIRSLCSIEKKAMNIL